MGTWGTALTNSDTFQDIYQSFFELYNNGENPNDISAKILEENFMMFMDYDDKYDSYFALALAQWETKSLAPDIFEKVKGFIESGEELKRWSEDADGKIDKKREKVLLKFLAKISTEKEKPKRKARRKFDFVNVELVNIIAPDNTKTFQFNEEFVNGKYIHTSGYLAWANGGGAGIAYFADQGKYISASWLDSQTIKIIHDRTIIFRKKEVWSQFYKDVVQITYEEL